MTMSILSNKVHSERKYGAIKHHTNHLRFHAPFTKMAKLANYSYEEQKTHATVKYLYVSFFYICLHVICHPRDGSKI